MVLKDKLVMKKVCMLLLLLFICNIGLVLAQGRRFGFELGANYPIGLQKNGYKENHVGFYLNGIYRFPTNPWHYKIFCVNGNTGFRNESRIFYFIHLQNEEAYERKESSSA